MLAPHGYTCSSCSSVCPTVQAYTRGQWATVGGMYMARNNPIITTPFDMTAYYITSIFYNCFKWVFGLRNKLTRSTIRFCEVVSICSRFYSFILCCAVICVAFFTYLWLSLWYTCVAKFVVWWRHVFCTYHTYVKISLPAQCPSSRCFVRCNVVVWLANAAYV